MQLVSVIIANYNRKAYLEDCLNSLFAQSHNLIEVIVVDNGSNDSSRQLIKDKFPQVHLIVNADNQFYSRAQDQGIKIAKGKYILCLNNDTILDKHFIRELVETMDISQEIGMVCGKIMSWDKLTIDSAGQTLGRSRRPIERGYKKKDTGKFDQPGFIFSAGGVAPLYRFKMLQQIKLDNEYFDEGYGMFYEDLDLAWRANLLGWKGYYNPRALAYHHRGGTAKANTPKNSLLKQFDFSYLPEQLQLALVRNRYMTILKNDCLKEFILNLPWILSYEIKLWGYLIFFKPRLIPLIIRNRDYLKRALKKRKKIWRLKKVEDGK